jgi:hypothetical protein
MDVSMADAAKTPSSAYDFKGLSPVYSLIIHPFTCLSYKPMSSRSRVFIQSGFMLSDVPLRNLETTNLVCHTEPMIVVMDMEV